jgi:RNA-binding protein
MATLTGKQRRHLRAEAHALRPVVRVGRHGVSKAVLHEIDKALADHELVKVQYVAEKQEKRQLEDQVELGLRAASAGGIGHVLIFYRQHADPEKRRYTLPR